MLFVAFLTWWNLISKMRTPYLFATVVFDSHWILCHYLPKLLAFRFCWQLLGGGAEVEVPPALYRITSDLFYPIYLSVQLQITKPLAVISVSGCVLSYGNDRSNWGMLFCLSPTTTATSPSSRCEQILRPLATDILKHSKQQSHRRLTPLTIKVSLTPVV